MSLKTTYIAIVACLLCSCTGDDIPENRPHASERPASSDSCDIRNGGINVGGDDFGFDNGDPPTGIITPTV